MTIPIFLFVTMENHIVVFDSSYKTIINAVIMMGRPRSTDKMKTFTCTSTQRRTVCRCRHLLDMHDGDHDAVHGPHRVRSQPVSHGRPAGACLGHEARPLLRGAGRRCRRGRRRGQDCDAERRRRREVSVGRRAGTPRRPHPTTRLRSTTSDPGGASERHRRRQRRWRHVSRQ